MEEEEEEEESVTESELHRRKFPLLFKYVDVEMYEEDCEGSHQVSKKQKDVN